MRTLLVTMAGTPTTPSHFMPDNGLAGLAGCLLDAGHEVQVLDLNTVEIMERLFRPSTCERLRPWLAKRLESEMISDTDLQTYFAIERELDEHRTEQFDRLGTELAARVKRDRVQLLGFKLWNGDGWTGSVRMARAVRAAVGDAVFIVGGGSQVDMVREKLFATPGAEAFDAFSVAEGEPTVLGLGDHLDRGLPLDDVPNLILPSNGAYRSTAVRRVDDLEALPRPVYGSDVYPLAGKMRVCTFEETRGCPYRCAFCGHPGKVGNTQRKRAVRSAVDEMSWLREQHGFRGFKLGGSYTPSAYLRDLCNEIVDRKTRLPFCGYGRITDAGDADFPLFHRAGCETLFFGMESGSQIILDRSIHKGHKVADSVATLKACKAAGIYTLASTVFPNPDETAETRQATLDTLREISPDGIPMLFPIPLPGSRWFTEPERYGFSFTDRDAYVMQVASYKARLLLPFKFWDSLDYAVNGKPFAQILDEAAAFAQDVAEAVAGGVVHMSDEVVLMARLAGRDPREFHGGFCLAMMSGDVSGVESLIGEINTDR